MQAYVVVSSSQVDPVMYLDTGANNHITSELGNLHLHAEDYTRHDQVQVGMVKVYTFITSVLLSYVYLLNPFS